MARGPVYEQGNGWIRLCEILLYPLTRVLARRRFEQLDKLAITGPVLVVGNHISHLDPMYDVVMLRKTGRWPHVMAKSSLWDVPVLGAVLRGTDQIPVERGGGAGHASLDPATRALEDGKLVLIYPEGTITRDPERWPMRPRPGVAALALAGDFPVVPIAHWGAHRVWASYESGLAFRPLPRKDIVVRVGDPIDLADLRARPADARSIRDASYRIMTAVRDLVAQLREETPPEEFYDPKKAQRQAEQAQRPTDQPQPQADPALAPPAAGTDGEPADTGVDAGPEVLAPGDIQIADRGPDR